MRPNYPHWSDDLIRHNTRKSTNRLLEMVENGSIDPKDVVMMCVKFMSEDDVDEMCRINEVFVEEDEDEEEDEESFDPDGRRAEMPWDYGRHFDDEAED